MNAKVVTPWCDRGGRKYLDLEIGGQVRTVKVPFRYGRVLGCVVEGIRPIQDIQAGEVCQVVVNKKMWDGQVYWVLSSIKPQDS
jgi:hypothetical protein